MNKEGGCVMGSIYFISIRLVFIFCFLGTIIGCSSHLPTVTPIKKVKDIKSQKGVFYSLPKTVIRIEIPIISTNKKPGPLFVNKDWFYKKATNVGLEMNDITKEKSTTFSIGKATVSTISMPDENNTFFVKFDSKAFEDLNLTMKLSKTGLLESAKSDSTNRVLDIGVKVFESAASIAGKFITLGGKAPEESQIDDHINTINRILISRLDLITGTAGTITGGLPAETLKLMLVELDKKEQELMNALRGTTTKKEWTAVFEFEPEPKPKPKETEEDKITFKEVEIKLLSISESDGINELTDYCINYYSNPFGRKGKKTQDSIKLRISAKAQPALKIFPNDKDDSGSFFYRIPLQANVELLKNDKLFMAENVYIAQIGPIRHLPNKFNGKFGLLDLIFYTDTGSIQKIDTQAKAMEISDAIGRLGTSAADLTGKILTADDELTKLERKKNILELKKEIRDLEEELD